jgi:CSLREA domain-containing protein
MSIRLFAALVLLLASGARAATITVDATADAIADDGNCTLREAVRAANLNLAVDDCAQGTVDDVIVIPAGTYTLALAGEEDVALTGDLDVTNPVAIQGAGAATTIVDGAGLDRVFQIGGVTVSLSGLTIRGGDLDGSGVPVGGGVHVLGGTVDITDCVVDGNAAFYGGGVTVSDGATTITRTTFSGNDAGFGGGLFVQGGSVLVVDSTFTGNEVSDLGAAVATNGTVPFDVTIRGSLVAGNTSLHNAGGVANTNNGTMTIANSTISDNHAASTAGGVYNNFGELLTLSNVTVAFNEANDGGGIWGNNATIAIRNSIVAGNTGANDAPDCGGTIVSGGHNLIGDLTGCTGLTTATGDLTEVEAGLEPLAALGGATQVHALATDSPARDAGDAGVPGSGAPACEATDQRGVDRPQGAVCDIGAYEAPGPATTTTTTPSASTTTMTGATSTTVSPASTTTTTTLPPVCASPLALRDGLVKIGRFAAPAGDEQLTLKATLDAGAGLAPETDGVRLVVVDRGAGDAVLLDLGVPPGARGAACGAKDGWKGLAYRNRSGTMDPPACTPGSAGGLRSVRLRDRRAKGKGVTLTAKAKRATVAAPIGPLALTVVVAPGTCGTAELTASCTAKGKTWTCR